MAFAAQNPVREPWAEGLRACLGDAGFLSAGAGLEKYHRDWSSAAAVTTTVLRPRTTDEAASALRILRDAGVKVALQGGMTGLVGGALPQPGEVVLTTERMSALDIDPVQSTALVGAGVTLQALNDAARDHGLMFPVDMGSRGSATLGGMIATNAGGNRCLRYGVTRNSVIGLEVVLADGRILSNLKPLMKDNTGYDLKQLFIASEGTLGLITAARLKLEPLPPAQMVALVSLPAETILPDLLVTLRKALGPALTAFEVMWPDYLKAVAGLSASPAGGLSDARILALVEVSGQDEDDLTGLLAMALSGWMERHDGVEVQVSTSAAQAAKLWAVRDATGAAARAIAPYAGFDVSLPVAQMLDWVCDVHAALKAGGWLTTQTYGHFGDGNLHLVVGLKTGTPEERQDVDAIVYHSLQARSASISAEHGIGRAKKAWLPLSRSQEEIEIMRCLKRVFDPGNTLNPNRIFNMEEEL